MSTCLFLVAEAGEAADNQGTMQATPDQIRARLQAAISASTYDASSLARHIKRGQDYVRDFINGRKESIKPADFSAIEVALGLTHGNLTRSDVTEGEIISQVKSNAVVLGQDNTQAFQNRLQSFVGLESQIDFPIYSSIDNDDNGIMIMGQNPMLVVSRPWFMWNVKDGFGIIVSSEEAEPVFPIGVVALVNPALPAVPSCNILLRTDGSDLGEVGYKVLLRRYLGKTKGHWSVQRINDGEVEQFDRREWISALRVVGQVDDI